MCTENRVLFFEENWNLKVKGVIHIFNHILTNIREVAKKSYFLNGIAIKALPPSPFNGTVIKQIFFAASLSSIRINAQYKAPKNKN